MARFTLLASPPLPNVAGPAALIGEPARAAMLMHLMDGTARTAGELAAVGGVSPQSASAHLNRLVAGGLLSVRADGRSRHYALASASVANALEALAALRAEALPQHVQGGARMRALCAARHCYDHLAGRLGVAMTGLLVARGCLTADAQGMPLAVAPRGARWLAAHLDIDVDALSQERRPLVRACVDWTERRPHLAGALGAALLARARAARWIVPGAHPRALSVTPAGERAFHALGIDTSILERGAQSARRSA